MHQSWLSILTISTFFGDCFGMHYFEHLITTVEKFLDNSVTDEASGTCYEDTHIDWRSKSDRFARMILLGLDFEFQSRS